jgi:hypothetical protein
MLGETLGERNEGKKILLANENGKINEPCKMRLTKD